MNKYPIPPHDVDELRALHRTMVDKRDADRVKAVILLASGWTATKVAEALLIDRNTVRSYYKKYNEGGVDGLLERKAGGSAAWLTEEQLIELDCHLQQTLYLSAKEIAKYVEERWGIVYSERGMTDLLHRLGYTYKKPKLVPGKADAKAQEKFVEEYKDTKEKEEVIYFMDAVHPTHNPVGGYGWIKRGKEYPVPTNTGRKRVNINGAICIQTMEPVVRFDDCINAQSSIALFKQIEAKHPDTSTIIVMCDNAKYYRSRLVNDYLKHSRIKLIFLPPYSPNLNPIERVWKFFKKKVLYNQYYETFEMFQSACKDFFHEFHLHADALRSLVTDNFHIVDSPVQHFES